MLSAPRSLTGHTFVVATSTAISQVLYAFLITLVASRAGPADFGDAAVAMGCGGFFAGILDFGSTSYAVRELAAGRMTQVRYWDCLRGKLAVCGLGTAAIAVVGYVASIPELGVVAALTMVGRTLVMGVTVPPRAGRQFLRVAVVTLMERVSAVLIFVLLFMGLAPNVITALWWSLGLGAAIASLVGLALAGVKAESLRRFKLRNPWEGVAGYGTFSLAVSACTLDVVVLGFAGTSAQAGVYGAVGRWTQPVQLLSQALSSTATPFIAGARSTRAAFESVRGSMWVLALGVATCGLIVTLAPTVIPAVLGNGYLPSVRVLSILTVGAALVVVNQPLATFLQSRGYDKFVGVCTIATVILQLVGVWLVASSLGAVGAALCFGLAQLILTIALIIGARSLIRRDTTALSQEAGLLADAAYEEPTASVR